MFQFSRLASATYEFSDRCSGFTRSGFSHSVIPGSKDACSSPGLIAACHDLHRLPVPRHPPYALIRLTILFYPREFLRGSFKVARTSVRARTTNFERTMQCALYAHASGGERIRTDDLLRARQSLSQLSYTPQFRWIHAIRIGPEWSRTTDLAIISRTL